MRQVILAWNRCLRFPRRIEWDITGQWLIVGGIGGI